MSHTLRFRPEVVADLEQVSRWCEERTAGRGVAFLQESRAAFDRISQQPEQMAADAIGIRFLRLRPLPN